MVSHRLISFSPYTINTGFLQIRSALLNSILVLNFSSIFSIFDPLLPYTIPTWNSSMGTIYLNLEHLTIPIEFSWVTFF